MIRPITPEELKANSEDHGRKHDPRLFVQAAVTLLECAEDFGNDGVAARALLRALFGGQPMQIYPIFGFAPRQRAAAIELFTFILENRHFDARTDPRWPEAVREAIASVLDSGE